MKTAKGPPSPCDVPNSSAMRQYLMTGTRRIAQTILRTSGSQRRLRERQSFCTGTHAETPPTMSSSLGIAPAAGKIPLSV